MVRNKHTGVLSTQIGVFRKTKDWDPGVVSNVCSVDMNTNTVCDDKDLSTG